MGNEKFDSPQKPSVETKITYGLLTVKKTLRKARQELHMPFRLTPVF
jgi:hypothetical protein